MKKLYIKLITFLFITSIWAQQDTQYTQYMYNMSVLNPAYTTGKLGEINFGGLYRTQWVGVHGAPTSANLFIHSPINDKVEVGISFVNDEIGNIVKTNDIFADVAYRLNLEEHGVLSFGVKAGVSFFDLNFTGMNLESGAIFTDPSFSENIHEAKFNFGTGVYFNTDNYYVGFSVPYILQSTKLNKDDGKYQEINKAHFYLTGGYVFDINEQFKFKPAFLMKAVQAAPVDFDLTANFLYENRLEFGLGYRFGDGVTGLVNFGITPELRLGYAYDYTVSNLGPYSSGSHEFFLLYNLDSFNLNKGFDKSPRFF